MVMDFLAIQRYVAQDTCPRVVLDGIGGRLFSALLWFDHGRCREVWSEEAAVTSVINCNQTAWIVNVAGEKIAKIEVQRIEGKTVLCRLIEDNIQDDLRQRLRELAELIEMQAISDVDEVGDRVDQSAPEIELVDHTRIAICNLQVFKDAVSFWLRVEPDKLRR